MIKINNKAYSERVILASECNFKCAYCYQKEKRHLLMSREIADKRIQVIKDYIQKHPKHDVCLNLFGGEPMLNWDVFKYFVETFNDVPQVFMSTITNGSFLTQDKIDYLKNKNIKIHISLDGTNMSNLMRIGKNKKQTFNIIDDVMKRLRKDNTYFAVNMTIGKNNVRFIKEGLDYLKALGVPEVHLQFMTYPSYRITDEQIEEIITYAESIKDNNFNVIIGLLKKTENIETIKESTLSKNADNPIIYEKWVHTQANGFSYEFVGCIGTGFSDQMAFCLSKETDFSNSNILSYTDSITGESKQLKTVEEL